MILSDMADFRGEGSNKYTRITQLESSIETLKNNTNTSLWFVTLLV